MRRDHVVVEKLARAAAGAAADVYPRSIGRVQAAVAERFACLVGYDAQLTGLEPSTRYPFVSCIPYMF